MLSLAKVVNSQLLAALFRPPLPCRSRPRCVNRGVAEVRIHSHRVIPVHCCASNIENLHLDYTHLWAHLVAAYNAVSQC